MRILLNPCPDLLDWYTIVRAEHDSRMWVEQTGKNSFGLRTSERLSPEACIEGCSSEMLSLAKAIRNRGSVSFKRCAVYFANDGVHLFSPRNSVRHGVVTVEEADEFAQQVFDFFKVEARQWGRQNYVAVTRIG